MNLSISPPPQIWNTIFTYGVVLYRIDRGYDASAHCVALPQLYTSSS